jgi:hypothetical protein
MLMEWQVAVQGKAEAGRQGGRRAGREEGGRGLDRRKYL